MIYGAWLCPSEQDPVSPSASLSHQEASISLLSFSIRGQTDWKPQSQKTKQSNHMDHKWVSEWVKSLSRVWIFATPWTIAYQALPSMEFSRQEYWSGLPFSSSRDLPDPGIKQGYPALQADALPSEAPGMKLWAMLCRTTQDGQVMIESSDTVRSTGEVNGKPHQYSCLVKPMNSMKRQKDRTLKD